MEGEDEVPYFGKDFCGDLYLLFVDGRFELMRPVSVILGHFSLQLSVDQVQHHIVYYHVLLS